MTWPGWDHQLLGALGLEPTRERRRFLTAWARAEGGNARYNPLNTTMSVPGALDYNSVHVKHYPDQMAGIAATLLTLRLAYYRALVDALRETALGADQILHRGALGVRTWGTSTQLIGEILKHG